MIGGPERPRRTDAGARCLQNNTASLASWLEVLKDDRRRLFLDTNLAEKACGRILVRARPGAKGTWATSEDENETALAETPGQVLAVQDDLAASNVTT